MDERIDYRARKWLFQRLPRWQRSNQLNRLAETNWDILVILDACRLDTLRQAAGWPVEAAISPASCTPDWLEAVSEHRALDGAHVVAGNPQYKKTDTELGCGSVEPYWESHWEESLQTTLPEPILDRADALREETSNRIVAHLQQPHWPYVSQLGGQWQLAYDGLGPWSTEDGEIRSVQVAMQRKSIDTTKARRAYAASVQSVWNVLEEYLGLWVSEGQTVIVTADHGETFGRLREFGFYEHPCGCDIPSLITVPWIEMRPKEGNGREMQNIEERLEALGYAD